MVSAEKAGLRAGRPGAVRKGVRGWLTALPFILPGLILVAEDNVTIRNAPKGTKILVAKGISSTRVNGKGVTGGTVYYAEEQSSSAAQ